MPGEPDVLYSFVTGHDILTHHHSLPPSWHFATSAETRILSNVHLKLYLGPL